MRAAAVLAAALATTGCKSEIATYPVTGKVTYPDGTPVTSGVITFKPIAPGEGVQPYLARGIVMPEGTFVLTTFHDADGAMAGRHQAIVMEAYSDKNENERPPSRGIAAKYSNYDTSKLEFDVKEQSNEISIVVEPANQRPVKSQTGAQRFNTSF